MHGEYRPPGGTLVEADAEVADARLASVRVSGDSFPQPGGALDRVNAALTGIPADEDASVITALVAAALGVDAWPAGLTDREVEVLRAITRGLGNKQIARELHVSPATVHTHVINLYGKIGVNTRAGATLYAFEHDLTEPGEPVKDRPNG